MRRSLTSLALAVSVAALLLVACAKLEGLSDLQVVECPTGCDGAAGSDSAIDASADSLASDAEVDHSVTDAADARVVTCSGTAGPSLVNLGPFCIDSTEVTNAHYAAFLAAAGNDKSRLPPSCSTKTTFVPPQLWPATAAKAAHPVVWVDWCDAYAYCAFAGKRLCGAIGGGPSALASLADKNVDQWYSACSASGASTFPYGSKYVSGKCNDLEGRSGGTRPVGTYPGCEGATPGVFDMAGNAFEWEDACSVSVGPSDSCTLRGGSWQFSGAQNGVCAAYFSDYVVKRSDFFNDTGFRCCSR